MKMEGTPVQELTASGPGGGPHIRMSAGPIVIDAFDAYLKIG